MRMAGGGGGTGDGTSGRVFYGSLVGNHSTGRAPPGQDSRSPPGLAGVSGACVPTGETHDGGSDPPISSTAQPPGLDAAAPPFPPRRRGGKGGGGNTTARRAPYPAERPRGAARRAITTRPAAG